MSEVILEMEPFDAVTKILSKEAKLTLQAVVTSKFKLDKELNSLATDSSVISRLKQHLIRQLEEYFKVISPHCVATLLDPRLENDSTVMSTEQRAPATELLTQILAQVSERDIPQDESEDSAHVPEKKIEKESEDSYFRDVYATGSGRKTDEVIFHKLFIMTLIFLHKVYIVKDSFGRTIN
jgi:hypothetical protein